MGPVNNKSLEFKEFMESSLSVVIVALNEERTIGRTIGAIRPIAREIIVVDSGSSDSTVAIAESFGAKVVHQEWLGYAAQKNFAMSLATQNWILSLDADEVMTPLLVSEISELLESESANNFDGFFVPRVLYIGDRPVWNGGFYPDAQLRLVRRGKGQFNDRLVHEAIKVSGRTRQLTNYMDHFSYSDMIGFENAMDKYARLSAQEYLRKGTQSSKWKTSSLNESLHPVWTFVYRFFLRRGFLDGMLGLKLALIYSGYVRNKIKYHRELLSEMQPRV